MTRTILHGFVLSPLFALALLAAAPAARAQDNPDKAPVHNMTPEGAADGTTMKPMKAMKPMKSMKKKKMSAGTKSPIHHMDPQGK
jgi:hypothetical protein